MNAKLPQILESKLSDFRRRVWIVKLLEGVCAAAFGIGLSYLSVFALDRFLETPVWLRVSLAIAGGATLGIGLPLKWHHWVWKQRGLANAARLLRRTYPRLGDQLLGIVELARVESGATGGRSERLVQAAMEQAADAIRDKDLSGAVPNARHRQWAWAVVAVGLVVGLAFVWTNEAAVNALGRWLTPWRALDRFTFAQIESLPARLIVPYAEPFELPVYLSAHTRRSPDSASGRLGRQPERTAPLESGSYRLSFPPQKTDAALALSLGDVRKTLLVIPRTRPELTELAVRIQLPDYLGYQSEQRIEIRGGAVNAVKGAAVALEARASRELAGAELDGLPQPVVGDRVLTGFTRVAQDTEQRVVWTDVDGLSPRDPLLLKIRAVEDEAPRIMARRDSLEQVVLESEVVTFQLNVADDFGVKAAGLEWIGSAEKQAGKGQVHGEKLSAAGGFETKTLETRATFCAARDGVAPQSLEVRGWVEDYLPGRPRARSAAFVLRVLDKTEHSLWVTEQLGKWLGAAKESYEREQQLHATNQELRALSAAELDRPETRRRLAQQASAESANASRLENLTQAGRSLLEQATRNDEFDAKRLEAWAGMLKSLKDIASTRMPGVADLLKQTANAPGGKTPDSNPGGTPSQTADGAPSKPTPPGNTDREAALGKMKEAQPAGASPPPGDEKTGLPQTTLAPASDGRPPESPAQQKADAAIHEQKELLAEFSKVSDQLGEILGSLEASTFVKRLKAASREQLGIAKDITTKTLGAFGIEREVLPEAESVVKKAKAQSEVVRVIQSDLDAYAQRNQDRRLKRLLEEMKRSEVIRALARDGEMVSLNLSGQSLSLTEFWADTLDRWAEELVAASKGKASEGGEEGGDSLPPEVVLKVMSALRDEMYLRDETREVESSKAAVPEERFVSEAKRLAAKQAGVLQKTQSAVEEIEAIQDGALKFAKEVGLLRSVAKVMNEAGEILAAPDTGGRAVAAETEAIELLLQAKRSASKGSGGGGTSPGEGGRADKASSTALSDLGPGTDAGSGVAARPVGQATGRAGREFPEEFKAGLDSYFNLLEGTKR